jgi:hypothetical protein
MIVRIGSTEVRNARVEFDADINSGPRLLGASATATMKGKFLVMPTEWSHDQLVERMRRAHPSIETAFLDKNEDGTIVAVVVSGDPAAINAARSLVDEWMPAASLDVISARQVELRSATDLAALGASIKRLRSLAETVELTEHMRGGGTATAIVDSNGKARRIIKSIAIDITV